MDDKIRINLQLAGNTYPLPIRREDEEIVRKAAKQVDMRLNAYREHYKEMPVEKLLAMVAYQFALESLRQQQRNDTAPYVAKITELTDLLEDYFKK